MYNVGQKNIPLTDKRDNFMCDRFFREKSSGPRGTRQTLCP